MHNLLRSLQKRIHGSQSSTLKNLRPVRRARRRPRQSLEALEDRALLAAVLWDGGGDGSSWGDADNWDTNAVPTIGDDVTIANAEVSVSESLLVRTLTTTDTTLNFSGGYSIGADDVEIGVGSAINAGSNSFQIHGRYNGRSINIGAWEVLAWQMNLTEAELNRVDTPHLTIGDDNDGWIPVRTTAADETISLNTHLTLRNSGTISFYDSLELNGNDLTAVSHSDEHQVDVWGNALTNVGGDISLESARRIRVGANGRIQTSTGDITLSANVAGDGQGEFNGVSIEGQVRTIGTGSITIEGRGGNAADKEHQLGVTIFGFGIVESTAATNGGKIDITGWGGGGTNVNVGVDVGSKIIGQSGPISIAGYGGGTGSNNMGVSLYSNARVESLSRTATVDVVGFGAGWTSDGSVAATANGENNGIQISGAAQITSTGVVTVVGYGAGSGDDNNGVHLTNGQISSVEQTNITGFGAGWDPDHQLANNAGSLNDGIRIENSSRVGGSGGLTLEGTGGEGAGYNRGVLVEGASVGAESLSIVGMGGHGAAGRNIGVFLPGGGRWFRPFNGSAISVHGTGGSSTDSAAVDNDGIVVRASVGYTTTFQTYFLAGDTVEFVGLGGTGGIGAHTGIEFSGFDEIRASELLSISGTGNVGVHFNNTSGGSSRLEFHGGSVGDIQVAGSGVSTGILVSGGPEFYSHDGDIIFDGTAERNGVLIDDHRHAPDAVFKTTGAGEIRLTGTTQRTTDDGSVGVGIETVEFDTSATATGRVHIVGHSDAAASLESPDVRIGNDVLTTTTPRITGETVDIGPSGDLLVEVRDNGPTNWHEAVEADRVRLGDGLNYPQLAITTSPSFEPVRTDEFVIIDNTGTQPLDGGFWWETSFGSYDSGGAIARRNGDDWVINYEGGDGNDLSIHKPLVVTTTADSGSGSLRDAIEFANANPRLDVIVFDLPVNAPQVIQLQSPLPSISDSLQIRGTYIASKDGVEEPFPVEIRGAGTTDEGQPPVHGIEVLDGGEISDIDVTLEGLVVRNFSGHGIYAHTGGSLTTDSVTSGANGGSGFYVGPGFGSIDLNQSRSGVTADGMSADSNAEYGIHIVRDDVLSDASEIAVNGTQASGNVLGGLLIDDQRTEAANGQVAYSIFYSAFGISTDRAYAIPNGNFGARITQTGDAPLPAEHHEIRQGTFAGNQGVGLWLDNSREFVLPPGFESNFGVGRSDSGDRIPVPNEIGLRLTNASSISGDTDFSGGGDDGSYGGYYEGVSGTISGAIIKHNSEIGLLIEADETVAGRRLDISEILVEDNARGIVTQLNDDYALGEGYQLNLHGETKGNESPGIEIIGNGENAVVNLLVDAEDNSGAGVRIETSSPRVNIHRRPELAAGAIRNNEGPGIRHTGSGENLRVYRQPAADFGSGTEDPDTYSPQIFVNQGLSIDLRSEGPSANTDSVSVHPVIESADLAEDGFLDITGTNGAAAGFFLQFYATSPKLDGRGNLQTPLGNYTQLSGATIPQDVLDVLPGAPARIFDQDFDPERFRFRIEVGPDFNRGLLTAVVVDPTLGQATSDFIGVSELAPMVPIGTQLTALPPVLDIGGSESIFADDLFERTVSFTDEDSSEFAITVDYGEGDGPQPIDFRPEDRSIFLEHEYQNVGDYLVSVLIIDDTAPIGQIDIESFTVTVENTPPDIRFNEFTLNKRVNEGETVDLAGFFDDLNIGDRHTITIDWGDGSTSEQGPLNFSDGDGSEQNVFDFSHVYVDDGASRADAHVYRVVANIVDEHGGVAASPVFLIEVDNVLPEAQAASFDDSATVLSTTIVEGSSVTFFASLTDVGLKDSHDVWVDWGDESPRERVSINEDTELRTFSATHTYLDNSPDGSPFEITWTVEDDDAPGQLVPGEPLYVTVENAAATVGTLELNQPSLREGLTAVLFIPFTDPGTEARTATVDWGNGEVTVHDIAPGAISATVSHRYLQELRNDSGDLLDYTINATVNDGVADSNTASIGVKITDAPITVGALTLSSSQVDEGDSVTVSGTFSSDSPTDTYTVEIDWGNGETTSAQVDNTAGTYTATYRYDDGADPDSEFLVSATVANGFTSQSRFAATTVEVSNVAPTVFLTPAAPTTDDEILLLADAFDPSDSDSANLTFDWAVNVPFTTRDGGRILVIDPDDIGGGFSGPSLISVVASVSVTDPDGVESDTASVAIIADITGENEVELTDASFPAGVDTLVVAGLDGDDVLDASGVSSSKSVILIGGSGDDLLFDGAGDDIILLADGNDSLNPPMPGITPNAGGDDLIQLIPNSTLTVYDGIGNNTLSFELADSDLTQNHGITFDLSETVDDGSGIESQDVSPGSDEPNAHFVAALGNFTKLVGSDYGDSLTGSSDSTVAGGSGADKLFAAVGSTNSSFEGGADDDILTVPVGAFGDLNFGGDDGLDVLLNAGTISGLTFGGGADDDILNNTGTITATLNFGGDDGLDALLNTGTIGKLNFGGGADDDILQNTGAGVITTLNFGGDDGLDVLLNSAGIGTLTFGGGADDDIFVNNGPTNTTLNFGGDDDILLSGSGTVADLNFGGDDGLDILVNLGTVTGTLTFNGGADDDIFLNGGVGESTLNFGGDDDTLLSGMGTIADLNFGGDDGADVLLNTGTLTTLTFTGGADDDIFVNNGPTETTLNFGGDDDILLAGTGTVGDLNFGGDDGADILLNLGGVTGTLTFEGGADDDIFLNAGTETSVLNFGGDDEILLSGSGTVADLNFGGDDGADVLLNTGTLTTLTFTGGADDDIFVNNGATNTTLNFGGDDDILLAGTGTVGDLNFGGDDGFDTLLNFGTADTLNFGGGADDDILQNTGTVNVALNFGGDDGLDVLTNTGTVTGLTFGGGADDDVLRNTGTVHGELNFGGDQQLDLETGELISNTTSGDDGLDSLLNTGTIESLTFGGGADDDILQNTGTVTATLNFGGDDGNDVLLNSGTIHSLEFTGGADDDILQNRGTVTTLLDFGGDDGHDILVNTNSIGTLIFTGGADADTLIALGDITSLTFTGGADDDVLQVQATSLDSLSFHGDDGNDIFVNRTGSLTSLTFTGGADDDVLINRGSEINTLIFNGDGGSDSFVNSGDAPTTGNPVLEFNGGDGSNAFRNEGKNWDSVTYIGGDDADFFQNNGTEIGGLSFSGGVGFNAFENNADFIDGLIYEGTTGDDVFANDGDGVRNLMFIGDDGDNTLLNTGNNVTGLEFNGGSGADVFINRGNSLSEVTFDAGAGDDIMVNDGQSVSDIEFIGGAGADFWFNRELAWDAHDLVFTAGSEDNAADRFLNEASGWRNFLTFEGGLGDDQFINRGNGIGTTLFSGGEGDDIAFNSGQYVRQIELNGGLGDDVFENRGSGNRFRLIGGDGNDSFLQNLGTAYEIEVIGGPGDDKLLNFSDGVNSLLLDGGDGHDILQNTGDGFGSITVTGDSGENTLHNFGDGDLEDYGYGDGGELFLDLTGSDTDGDLINSGSYLTLITAEAEGSTTVISRGDHIDHVSVMTGDANDAVRLTGKDIGPISIDTGDGADSVQLDIESRADDGDIDIATGDADDLIQLRGELGSVTIDAGNGDDRFVYAAIAEDTTLNGNLGDDTYTFVGAPAGSVAIEEAHTGSGDVSADGLDFSALNSGAITLDLAETTGQSLPAPSGLEFDLTLSDQLGIENVIGTTGADTIHGNARDNALLGARYPGDSQREFGTPTELTRTQWVVLDFATETTAGELLYSAAVTEAIQQRVEAMYEGFDLRIVRRLDLTDDYKSELPADIRDDSSQFVTIFFNSTPPSGRPGGQASEIDIANVNPGGTADVQISGMLGGREVLFSGTVAAIEADGHEFQAPDIAKPAATEENLIALSSKLAAHELAHLLGMRHYDAYGPIGSGINAAPGHHEFTPNFPGPASAFETADHITSSPASAGTDRFNDLRELYFGQREAVKLALAFTDPTLVRLEEPSGSHGSLGDAAELQPVKLTVPNTADGGVNQAVDFQAQGIVIAGSIELDSNDVSESDWYSFEGFAGDIVTVEVMSRALARYSNDIDGNLDHAGYIDSVLRLFDSSGTLVQSYGQEAINDDEFESSDSLLMDVVIPADGSYYIEVDTFSRSVGDDSYQAAVDFRNELEARRDDDDPTNDLTADEERFLARLIDTLEDTDTGSYELVMYVASSTSASDGIDNLQGREGVDTFEAGDDDDYTLITDLTGPTESEPGLEWTGTVDLTDRGGYSWSGSIDFGDETDPVNWTSSPGSTEISHTFANLGIYTVTVTITNDDGQSHESTLVLDVSEDSVEITELDINGGLENRSVVKTADIVFSDSTFAADLLANLTDNDTTNDQLRVERRDLAGNSLSTPEYLSLPASAFTVSGNTLTIDFGSLGIQQNGVFAIQVDTDRDFDFDEDDKEVRFHRLLADVNGDGEVDHTDYQKIRSAYRRPDRYTDADVDGDGIVGRLDLRIFNSLARTRFQDKLLFGRDALDD